MRLFSQLFPVLMAVEPLPTDHWATTAALPDTVKAWDEVRNSETPDKFWDQVTNMRERMGRSITIPGKDAGSDDWKTFNEKLITRVPTLVPKPDPENPEQMRALHRAMGLPDAPEKYTVPEYDNHGIENVDASRIDAFRPIAHKAGLSDRQFQTIVKEMSESTLAKDAETIRIAKADQVALKTEWGAAYDERSTAVHNFLKLTDAPKEIQQMAEKRELSSGMMKWFYAQQQAVSEGGTDLTKDKQTSSTMTPMEAQQTISEIMNNKDHAYWKRSDPGHAAAMQRMVELHRLANPPKTGM